MIGRRTWLMALGAGGLELLGARAVAAATATAGDRAAAAPEADPVLSDAPLVFPRDHGAHPETRVEWWYVTGVLRPGDGPRPAPGQPLAAPAYGFQLTFFRVARTLDRPLDSRFAPSQIMLGHAAVTDLGARRLHHDQRLMRQGFANASTAQADTRVRLGDWSLQRHDGPDGFSRYQLALRSETAKFALSLTLSAGLPPLLQGRGGWSQKGPQPQQASRYVSEPQLRGSGQLAVDGQAARAVQALCWMDHEWSHAYLGRGQDGERTRAVGWDWLGLNLDDGSSLTLFQMRRLDGSTLWTGGSWRDAAGAQQDLQQQLRFEPLAWWQSPVSLARYPVKWRIQTPRGAWLVETIFSEQEVDARRTTGFLYWEGVVRLSDGAGAPRGWGYLEMTGYAGRVPL